MGLRVLVVADDALAGAGLAALLSGQQGVTVEQAAVDADLVTVAEVHDPDVIVWDLGGDNPATPHLSAIADLDIPVIVLCDDEARVSEGLAAGARGVLPRDTEGAPLMATLEAVLRGLVVIDGAFAPTIVPARGETPDMPTDELTPREREVLQLLAEGLPNKQIASQLGISEHTVKSHVTTIFSKLGAHSRTEAVTRAAHLGLIVL